MKNNFGKAIIFFSAIIFLGGCSFISSKNNTEIIQNNTETETQDNTEKIQNNAEEVEAQKNTAEKQDDAKNTNKNNSAETSVKVPKINNKLVSWGFEKAENRKIDTIIIHSSYNAVGADPHNLDDIIYKEYKPYGVSPHYIISRDGLIYRLVEDKNIAYHAGESKVPDGRTSVNNFSLGIEIVNTKSEKPNDSQYGALNDLLTYLKSKYKIKYTLGHSDIAPGRKDDPWGFDWDKIK
ncbi:MAG TPA: N-acetylmuramoyl-L-alanine amidase [Candidatus Moranbacteria bacterium]|nr:N-acetylmuramoyl-L-alanine amidase [Candidatus Moranbacteria bacterium]